MKSRTLSSDQTLFRKLFSRFSPLWVWYSVFLLLVYLLNLTGSSYPDFDNFYEELIFVFPIFNGIYGCMSAMTLFGYLCDSRECNMLHTWPVRRESHFFGRILAGFLFHFVPDLTFFLLGLPFTCTLSYAIRWLILMELQFICFFGIGVLCMLLSGRKLAAAALFILANSLSLLILWVVSTLYQPRLYGVELNQEAFMAFSPLYRLITNEVNNPMWPLGPMDADTAKHFLYAGVGLVSMGLGLILYRRRQLETAGDFIAVNWLKPFFVLAMSISVGSFLSAFLELFGGQEDPVTMIILTLGLLTGYFASLMFLKRSPRVFGLKNCLRGGVIVVSIFLSLWITELDPLGRVDYVPQPEQIAFVNISHHKYSKGYTATTDAEKADIAALHRSVLDMGIRNNYDIYNQPDYDHTSDNLYLEYHLKNGGTVLRSYLIYRPEHQKQANYYHSQPDVMFSDITDLKVLKELTTSVHVNWGGVQLLYVDNPDGLLDAIWRDCEEGHMYMNEYYPTYEISLYLWNQHHYYLQIPVTATHTIDYIETFLLNDELIEKIHEEWETNWKGYEDFAYLPPAN